MFQEALHGETSYVSNLAQSLSLALEEFYSDLKAVGVSAMTGKGMEEFVEALDASKEEYESEYKAEYDRLKKEKEEAEKVNFLRVYGNSVVNVTIQYFVEVERCSTGQTERRPQRRRRWALQAQVLPHSLHAHGFRGVPNLLAASR